MVAGVTGARIVVLSVLTVATVAAGAEMALFALAGNTVGALLAGAVALVGIVGGAVLLLPVV
jgi:hypothetical protein